MKYILIKLFIGLVLFGTLVALRLLNIDDADIKTLCVGGLMGMGIMHLGATPAPADDIRPDKQGGFAAPLALLMAFAMAVSVTACGSTSTVQDARVAYTQSCAAYGGAFKVMVALRKAGKLNESQISQVSIIDGQITPICTGPLPEDLDTATAQVTGAVTALTILEATK